MADYTAGGKGLASGGAKVSGNRGSLGNSGGRQNASGGDKITLHKGKRKTAFPAFDPAKTHTGGSGRDPYSK